MVLNSCLSSSHKALHNSQLHDHGSSGTGEGRLIKRNLHFDIHQFHIVNVLNLVSRPVEINITLFPIIVKGDENAVVHLFNIQTLHFFIRSPEHIEDKSLG